MAGNDVIKWGNVGFLLFPGFEVLDVYGEEMGFGEVSIDFYDHSYKPIIQSPDKHESIE